MENKLYYLIRKVNIEYKIINWSKLQQLDLKERKNIIKVFTQEEYDRYWKLYEEEYIDK